MQKSFLKSLVIAVVAAFAAVISPIMYAQGVVTSGITGTVVDGTGKAVSGANVVAVHTPTNRSFTAVSRENGRYTFRGLPVGGPYTVTATANGLNPATASDIQTSLGGDTDVALELKSEVVELEKFVATGSRNDLDGAMTGAKSVITNQRITQAATQNRSFADMVKSNPFVSIRSGTSVTALGQNNKYNSIQVDGARINDQFGLNANGIQSFNNPLSLETVEQFTVSLAPYDVRSSGFTGASINAVTKRGTNQFSGSIYYIYTDSDRQGKDVFGTLINTRPTRLHEKTYGFTLGGPILKDRLFFFVSEEKFKKDSVALTGGGAGFIPNQATIDTYIKPRIDAINAALGTKYDIGTFTNAASPPEGDTKRLAKLDWNINSQHRMSVRYSDTVGQNSTTGTNFSSYSSGARTPYAPSFGAGTSLDSRRYDVTRTEEVWSGQIFSDWTENFKTELAYSNTSYLQNTTTPITFPEIQIYGFDGVAQNGSALTNGSLGFGTENARHGNVLDVKTESYSATGDYIWKNFTFSGGFDREESEFYNLFRQGSYGVFAYATPAAFLADSPSGFLRAIVQDGTPLADISKFEQTGIFGQAKWEISSRLSATLGARMDFIGSPIAPPTNAAFATAFAPFFPGLTNDGTIDGGRSFAPRASFNYAIDEKRLTQLRGGIGIFLGRAPWVIFSNSYTNSGVGRFQQRGVVPTTSTVPSAPPTLLSYLQNGFQGSKFDPANPIGTTTTTGGGSLINLTADGTKLPSVLRGNIALDRKIPALNATVSLEYIQTSTLQAMFIDNLNLKTIGVGVDGRKRFGGATSVAFTPTTGPLVSTFGDVLRMGNTKQGSSQYLSLSFNRAMNKGWAYNVGYTRGRSTEVQNQGSTTAGSQFQFNNVFNQNTPELGRSDFEIKNRIQASITKEFTYWRGLKSTVSLYYEGRSGSPYSYVYSGDLNGDGFSANDLVAVPSGLTDARFDFSGLTAAQQTGYFAFINSSGLSKYAGSYAPKNTFFQPWQNRLDLHFSQEIPTISRFKVEVFLDFLNFGSFISKDIFNYIETLPVPGNTGLTRQFGNAAYVTGTGLIRPTPINAANFDANGNYVLPANSLITINNGDSRWRIQFGARLKF